MKSSETLLLVALVVLILWYRSRSASAGTVGATRQAQTSAPPLPPPQTFDARSKDAVLHPLRLGELPDPFTQRISPLA